MKILLAEDDSFLADGLNQALSSSGYEVTIAADGNVADTQLTNGDFDVVVLDLGLPGIDGLEVLKRLRAREQSMPVLILTARGSLNDKVLGLDAGANDYLTKPFQLPEFEARVRALARHRQWGNKTEIVIGNLTFDVVGRVARVNGTTLDLSARELCLLEYLLQRLGRLISKGTMAEHLSSHGIEVSYNAIDIAMHRLRKKLEQSDVIVKTVRGLGYLIEKSEQIVPS